MIKVLLKILVYNNLSDGGKIPWWMSTGYKIQMVQIIYFYRADITYEYLDDQLNIYCK